MSDIDIKLEVECYECHGSGTNGWELCEQCSGHGLLLTEFGGDVMEMVRRRLRLTAEPLKGAEDLRRAREANERYAREKAERETPEYKAKMADMAKRTYALDAHHAYEGDMREALAQYGMGVSS